MSHGGVAKNFAPQVADIANISRYTTSYWLYGISAVPLRIVILVSRNICFMKERETRYGVKICIPPRYNQYAYFQAQVLNPSGIYTHLSPMRSRGSLRAKRKSYASRVKSATALLQSALNRD